MSLNCIVCDGVLEDAFPDGNGYNQPHGGTTFTSIGHYGSTVWDPMPGWGGPNVFLEINVCDQCMKSKADQGVILIVEPPSLPPISEFVVRPWHGPEDRGEHYV